MRYSIFLVVFLLLRLSILEAQDDNNGEATANYQIRTKIVGGSVIDKSSFYNQNDIKSYRSIGLDYLFSSRKNRLFYQGLSIKKFHLGNKADIGSPIAIGYLMGFSLFHQKHLTLVLENELGLAIGWKTFDKVGSPENFHFSTKSSLSYSLKLLGDFEINRSVSLFSFFEMNHFSNGALRRPNHGLNALGYGLGARWRFKSYETEPVIKPSYPRYKTIVVLNVGNKQPLFVTGDNDQEELTKYQDKNYMLGSMQLLQLRSLRKGHFFGLGADLAFDPTASLEVSLDSGGRLLEAKSGNIRSSSKLSSILAYHYDIGSLELLFHQAYYWIGEVDFGGKWYQRYGFSYTIYHDFRLGFAVRSAGFTRSDWLEFSMSYEF